MRNFILFDTAIPNPEVFKAVPGVKFIDRMLHNLHARHEAQDLAQRDDHLLNDIGLLRSDVEHASHVTIGHDAMEELHEAQLLREGEIVEAIPSHNDAGFKSTNLRSKI